MSTSWSWVFTIAVLIVANLRTAALRRTETLSATLRALSTTAVVCTTVSLLALYFLELVEARLQVSLKRVRLILLCGVRSHLEQNADLLLCGILPAEIGGAGSSERRRTPLATSLFLASLYEQVLYVLLVRFTLRY